MGINNIIAFIWGFAEATLFFIVPDVWLSIIGRNNLKAGILGCLYGLIGALTGGLIIYYWGSMDSIQASAVIDQIPAISREMISRVQADMAEQGLAAIMIGPLKGTPYKIYAMQAAKLDIKIWEFLLMSIPARFLRFFLVTVGSHYLLKAIIKFKAEINSLTILLAGWILFYVFYFAIMSG